MTFLPSDTAKAPDGMISADDMVIMGLQAATQWDSLAHVGYDGLFYNNVPAGAVNNVAGATRNSFAKAVGHLISRGVLLDIARLKGVDRLEDSYEITSADLAAAEVRQGVQVESGDILLLRTGSYQWFLEGDRAHFMGDEPGPGLESCRWLYEREVAALALDNWACERWPSPIAGANIPFHQVTIRDMGLTLGEMFNFEELARDCEEDVGVPFLRPWPQGHGIGRLADHPDGSQIGISAGELVQQPDRFTATVVSAARVVRHVVRGPVHEAGRDVVTGLVVDRVPVLRHLLDRRRLT